MNAITPCSSSPASTVASAHDQAAPTHSDVERLSTTALEDEITHLAGHLYAAEYRLLCLIREWTSRGLCGEYGARTPAQWLNYKIGLDMGAAREKVRVANKLAELPELSAALACGVVSYAKVRAMTRVATPDNEAYLLGLAKQATAAQMEELTRAYKRVKNLNDPELLRRQYRTRALDWHFDEEGMLVIHARMAPDDGALFVKLMETTVAIMREDERALVPPDPYERVHGKVDAEDERPVAARRVDAMLRLMEKGSTSNAKQIPGGERVQVIVHVRDTGDAEQAEAAEQLHEPSALLDPGPPIPDSTARRLACDAARVVYTENARGEPLSIGRQSRTVPAPMRRALVLRDKRCRFPGCSQKHHVDAHHIHHWADGGETRIDNLVLLCRHHHRLIHEHGFDVQRTAEGEIRFYDREGQPMPEAFPLQPVPTNGLESINRRFGLSISAETCNGGYDGGGYDMGLMVDALHYHTTGEIELRFDGHAQ